MGVFRKETKGKRPQGKDLLLRGAATSKAQNMGVCGCLGVLMRAQQHDSSYYLAEKPLSLVTMATAMD